MNCDICGNTAAMYSTPDGNGLIKLCGKCAADNPTFISVTPQTPKCRQCQGLGKCCRTTNVKERETNEAQGVF